ncbi:MAG TPA: class I SAM-dependent methyltransferase [Burkholderiaceae bacterium]|nr:class I SAM-dependent methyltransferase [Burkholderiaceae bacterium]
MPGSSYEEKPDFYFNRERGEMLPFVPGTACRILEIGCGEGLFAAALKRQRPVEIIGIEPFAEAAREAATRIDQVHCVEIEQGLAKLHGEAFDCVVCNDVLEHLVDPWEVLRKLRALLRPGGTVVASIPNVRYMPVLKSLVLQGGWEYQDAGVLDRTHLRFFTQSGIRALFSQSGYRVNALQGINGIRFPWKFGLLNRLTLGALDDTRYVQFACVAEALPEPEGK